MLFFVFFPFVSTIISSVLGPNTPPEAAALRGLGRIAVAGEPV